MSFIIGIDHVKSEVNVGTLMRSGFNLGAASMFTVGRRYRKTASDTVNSKMQMPIWHFEDWEDYAKHAMPWMHIGVEITDDAVDIRNFQHPKQAVYILGAEDHGMTNRAKSLCKTIVSIPSNRCLNLAVAGSIIMYDRMAKSKPSGVRQ